MMVKRVLVCAAVIALPATGTVAVEPKTMASGQPFFVPMAPIRIPIVDGGSVTGSLEIQLVLDAVNADAAARLTADAPRLRAASVASALEFARLYPSSQTPVDAGELSIDVTRALLHADPEIARVLIVKVAASSA